MKKIFLVILLSVLSTTLMAKSIIVFGDSISAAYGIDVDQGWVNLLQKRLERENKLYTIFNESISGDTTAGGLARIDKALDLHNPSIMLLELGANDGLRGLSPEKMKQNLVEIISRSRQHGARVLLLGMRIPLNYGKRYIDLFYNIYPQLAEELKIPLVPFLLKDVALKKQLMQNDGLHPDVLAQPIIAETVWKYLHPML
jgi:acyl-CoA thioesterase-1